MRTTHIGHIVVQSTLQVCKFLEFDDRNIKDGAAKGMNGLPKRLKCLGAGVTSNQASSSSNRFKVSFAI